MKTLKEVSGEGCVLHQSRLFTGVEVATAETLLMVKTELNL